MLSVQLSKAEVSKLIDCINTEADRLEMFIDFSMKDCTSKRTRLMERELDKLFDIKKYFLDLL